MCVPITVLHHRLDTPMVEKSKLDEDKEGKTVDPSHYRDADHAGCQDTRRSSSGSLQFLGDRLISWSSKRQKSVAISSTEAKYIALSKHIDIKYHFIKEQVENGVIELYFVNTEYQLADLFTKALGRDRIEFLMVERLIMVEGGYSSIHSMGTMDGGFGHGQFNEFGLCCAKENEREIFINSYWMGAAAPLRFSLLFNVLFTMAT
nr:copia protein [Tanacetum cinerariifolium]